MPKFEQKTYAVSPASPDQTAKYSYTMNEIEVNFHDLSKEQLVEALRAIVAASDASAHKSVASIKQAFYVLKNKETEAEMLAFVEAGNQPEAFSSAPDEHEAALKDLLYSFREMRTAYLEAEEQRKQENLSIKRRIIDQIKSLAEDVDNINRHFPKFQELQQEFKAVSEIPAPEVADTWKNYQLAVEQFYDLLKMNKELRDLDFKKNLEIKENLINSAKELESEPDVIVAFKKLQELHDKWRETGPVAKELRDELWNRFKELSTAVNKRHQDYFESRKAEETANTEAKEALCAEIEKFASEEPHTFAEWDKATQTILELQSKWKNIGFASRKANTVLFNRFRKACDDFFTRKAEFFKKTKEDLAANLKAKTALCEQAEALKEQGDIKKGLDAVASLQAEWKKIGPVARKYNDSIWERFNTACRYFYEERRKATASQRQEENANLAAKRAVIEAMRAIDTETLDRDEILRQVKELQNQWQQIGHVPFRQKDAVFAEYREIADAIYGAVKSRHSTARINNYKERLSEMDGNNGLNREQDKLQRALEAKKGELKTAENNLGFFKFQSSKGNVMLKEMEKRIERIREDIAEIEQKISLIKEKSE